ncbi:MAG: hypothetical protein CMM30_09735, partial [Rhodospirillaceae bacterium]|nr:hypothetical protein [Rhodospirillaceae bacterium]
MKKTIYLHIGLPKTGTTFMQRQLEINRDILEEMRIYNPIPDTFMKVGFRLAHLSISLQQNRWASESIEMQEILPNLWERILDQVREGVNGRYILTAELLSWELSEKKVRELGHMLEEFAVKVVFTARDPLELIPSMYGQLLRTNRGRYSLEMFLKEFEDRWDPGYHRRVWGGVFGSENIVQLSYDDIKGPDILVKFLSSVFQIESEKLGQLEIEDIGNPIYDNHSFTPRFLRMLEELHHNRIDSSPFVQLLTEDIRNPVNQKKFFASFDSYVKSLE